MSRRLDLSVQAHVRQTAPYWVLSSECVVVVVGNYIFADGFTRYSAPRHAPRVSWPTSKPMRPRNRSYQQQAAGLVI